MMKVTPLAWTHFNDWAAYEETQWEPDRPGAEALAEFAGRACYQSFDKPNPATATTHGYLLNILKQKHLSVLRHGTVTFYVQGVSRSFTHELIRHHVGSDYSQLSQRYVEAEPDDFVVPPAMRGNERQEQRVRTAWNAALDDYHRTVVELQAEGKTRKEAREAARAFLPNCAETKIVVTGNHEAWRTIIERRGSEHADAEIREFAVEVLDFMKKHAPAIYQDMEICRGGDGVTTVCRKKL